MTPTQPVWTDGPCLRGDNDLPPRVALFLVSDSGRDVSEGVAPVDDRGYLAALDELGQRGQVVLVLGGPAGIGHDHSLGYQWCQRERPEHASGGLEPPACGPAHGDEGPVGFQRPHRSPSPVAAGDVQQQVVTLALASEVLRGVVDDLRGAERADQLGLRGAADAGDVGAERPGALYRERADASGGPGDQDLLAGLKAALI